MTERRIVTRIDQLENSLNELVGHHKAIVDTEIQKKPYSFTMPARDIAPQPRIKRYALELSALRQKHNEQA